MNEIFDLDCNDDKPVIWSEEQRRWGDQMQKERHEQDSLIIKEFMDGFDFARMAVIRDTHLDQLTDDSLSFIGIKQQYDKRFDIMYSCEKLSSGIKIYFTRKGDGALEMRGYELMKIKDILTTKELIDEAFTNWRIKP